MAQAQYNLGLLYESGVGVTRSLTSGDHVVAARRREQGHTDAQVQLATQYFLGRGAAKDWKLAAKWYEAAAAGGDAGAQYIIGSFYEHGDGVAHDLQQGAGLVRAGRPAGRRRRGRAGQGCRAHGLPVRLARLPACPQAASRARVTWARRPCGRRPRWPRGGSPAAAAQSAATSG